MELLKLNYLEFKEEQEKKANEFTEGKLFFAFGTTEEEVKRKLKEDYNVESSEVVGIGAGTYIKKEDYKEVMQFFDQQAKEFKEFSLANLYDVLTYEMANHELEISLSYSYGSFLTDWLGLTEEEIEANKEEIDRAIADYRKEFYEHN